MLETLHITKYINNVNSKSYNVVNENVLEFSKNINENSTTQTIILDDVAS